ncbi:MAG TPA: hypothetical protein PKL15_01425 [Saprospiraceae bacterium]|nr:hypothetical protein [Saprospiraceae bacterium]HNM24051.1 hypothetical protein [Saprospiraceae bacterium]
MRLVAGFVFLFFAFAGTAQTPNEPTDSHETLRWVQSVSIKIDSSLDLATRGEGQYNLLLYLYVAWEDFTAVAHAGLYCHNARIAAERGRQICDLTQFKQEKDLMSLKIRAAEARLQAIRMREAAAACMPAASIASAGYQLSDVLRKDAEIVANDLQDALAVPDFHVMAQKLEQVLDILHDMEYFSERLPNCRNTREKILAATQACSNALASDSWEKAAQFARTAQQAMNDILQSEGCR